MSTLWNKALLKLNRISLNQRIIGSTNSFVFAKLSDRKSTNQTLHGVIFLLKDLHGQVTQLADNYPRFPSIPKV